uniref:PGPS/D2 n=1 Tax=Petunia hybrida TaxID=4102 RepID=Q9ZTN5_PETHY|nr:PGPS/D2 [Petunia x hybrida]
MVSGFESVLSTTTQNKGYKDDDDDYSFMVAGAGARNCMISLQKNNIVDPNIARAAEIVQGSIAVANNILTSIKPKTT